MQVGEESSDVIMIELENEFVVGEWSCPSASWVDGGSTGAWPGDRVFTAGSPRPLQEHVCLVDEGVFR
jgi:hypothetical protein